MTDDPGVDGDESNALSPAPELAVLRASQDRTLEREGIPMILALVSELDELPIVPDQPAGGEGARLAADLDRFRTTLLPSSRDDDLGAVISVLQAVAFADFGARLRDEASTADRPQPKTDDVTPAPGGAR